MSEAPKSPFTFTPATTPATSVPASGSLFGQSTTANQSAPSNLFGQTNSTPASSAPGLFGNQSATSGPIKTTSIFSAGQTTSGGAQSAPLFGGGQATGGFGAGSTGSIFDKNRVNSTPNTGFAFGQKPAQNQHDASNTTMTEGSSTTDQTTASSGQTQTTNLFGAVGNSPGAPSSPFSNLGSNPASSAPAGSSTPASSKTTFGLQSTTPAGPPPSQSGGLFGFQKPQQSTSNLFGGSTGTQGPVHQTAQSAPSNLFGAASTQGTSNLFGAAKPADSAAGSQTGSNLFGGQQNAQPSSNLFGNVTKQQDNDAATPGTSVPIASATSAQQNQSETAAKPSPFSFPQAGGQQAQQNDAAQPSPFLFPQAGQQNQLNAGISRTFTFPQANVQQAQQDTGPKSAQFSFPSSTSQDANASKPASSLEGGTSKPADKPGFFPSTTTSDASTSKPTTPAFSFPTKSTTQASTAPCTTGTSTSNLFGGQGGTSASTSTPAATTAAPAFFPSQTSSATPATTAPQATSGETSQAPTTTAPATTASAPKPQQQTSNATPATTLGASTAGPAPPASSRLKGKSMDEIITRWAADLSKHQKDFQDAANKVATWDRLLVENSDKISKLYSRCFQAERDTAEVERQLSTVEGQQEELSAWLDRYEMEVERLMGDSMGRGGDGLALQGPDQERERTYKLAEKLSDRLNDMGKDLSSLIEEINAASVTLSKTSKPGDPLSQIVRVLNNHLAQLQIIDSGAAAMQAKVAAAQKESQRVGGAANGFGALGSEAAVDDFYRSYMRR